MQDPWDHTAIFPYIRQYLMSKRFPHSVRATEVQRYLENNTAVQTLRISRLEWCVSHALREFGYRRDSVAGPGYTKSNLGIIVPARE